MGVLVLFYIVIINLQEYIDTQLIMTFLAVTTGLFTVIAAFITWRIDRNRLSNLEIENKNMKDEIKENKSSNERVFNEIYDRINSSHTEIIAKVDELKMYLLNSKITLKGEQEQKE